LFGYRVPDGLRATPFGLQAFEAVRLLYPVEINADAPT
jgi:hypothetical protein